MNIFVVHEDPRIAATMLSDRHVIKMILESAQVLSTCLREGGYDGDWVYRATHKNHPCTKWANESQANFNWLLTHAFALCEEYALRYGKHHKSENVLIRCDLLMERYIRKGSLTAPPKAMKEEYRIGEDDWNGVVASYRHYYINGKGYMNKGQGPLWKKRPERKPEWFA